MLGEEGISSVCSIRTLEMSIPFSILLDYQKSEMVGGKGPLIGISTGHPLIV